MAVVGRVVRGSRLFIPAISFPVVVFTSFLGIAVACVLVGAPMVSLFSWLEGCIEYVTSPMAWMNYGLFLPIVYVTWVSYVVYTRTVPSFNSKTAVLLFIMLPSVCYLMIFMLLALNVIKYACYELFAVGLVLGIFLGHIKCTTNNKFNEFFKGAMLYVSGLLITLLVLVKLFAKEMALSFISWVCISLGGMMLVLFNSVVEMLVKRRKNNNNVLLLCTGFGLSMVFSIILACAYSMYIIGDLKSFVLSMGMGLLGGYTIFSKATGDKIINV